MEVDETRNPNHEMEIEIRNKLEAFELQTGLIVTNVIIVRSLEVGDVGGEISSISLKAVLMSVAKRIGDINE